MKHIGSVDAEVGILLLADAHIARSWRGAEQDGADYERAYPLLAETPGATISVGAGE